MFPLIRNAARRDQRRDPEDQRLALEELRRSEIPSLVLPSYAPWDATAGIVGVLHFGAQTVAFVRADQGWNAYATGWLPNGESVVHAETPAALVQFRNALFAAHGALQPVPSVEELLRMHRREYPDWGIVANAHY